MNLINHDTSFYFAQHHIYTQMDRSIDIRDMPHSEYVRGNKKPYIQYLKKSLPYYHKTFDIDEKLAYFDKKIEEYTSKGIKEPVTIYLRPNGDPMILDGNHRMAIGLFHQLDIPFREITLKEAIARIVNVSGSYYGTGNKGMPYQSIYNQYGDILLKGRRSDIPDRNWYIRPEDIKNKTIIDIGCNYGNALMLCRDAKKLIGVDIDKKVLTSAVRLSVVMNKKIKYIYQNMSTYHAYNYVDDELPTCDTAFVFSVDMHIGNLDGLEYFIRNNVKKVVYFETHERKEMPDQIRKIFSLVEPLANLRTRKLYRCVK